MSNIIVITYEGLQKDEGLLAASKRAYGIAEMNYGGVVAQAVLVQGVFVCQVGQIDPMTCRFWISSQSPYKNLPVEMLPDCVVVVEPAVADLLQIELLKVNHDAVIVYYNS